MAESEVKRRIELCLENKSTTLDLSGLGLKSIPNNLPNSLQRLNCSHNQITSISNNLPNSLQRLNCSFNQITSIPNNLPNSLQILECDNNKYLHISTEIAKKFELKETINYNKIIQPVQKIFRDILRRKRLRKLQRHIDEFIYRPKGVGYTSLTKQNIGLYADL